MKIALAQTNPLIGDVAGNTALILDHIRRARQAGAELAVFPEQSILGYPAKDLLLRREVVAANERALAEIAAAARGIAAIVGFAEENRTSAGRPVFNSAALISEGQILGSWRKRLLPTYDVFDEARYFEPAGPQNPVGFRGVRIGATICEDMLSEPMFGRSLYSCDPVAEAAAAGADLIVNLSASPYYLDKHAWRVAAISRQATRHRRLMLFVNQVGGNDELLFDGCSCAIDATGRVIAQGGAFAEDLLIVDTDQPAANRCEAVPKGMAALHAALVMGVRDYAHKCGFRHAVLGLSGGIDSAVVACLAADALGPENVHGVAMPSRLSSDHSVADARTLAERLRIRFSVIPIEPIHSAFEAVLAQHFAGRAADVAEENVQARVRGGLLMALSNKFGGLLLTTGNKSELATGYCTLYGDMCGGLAVISDVPKTMVYSLARHINDAAGIERIPVSTITKPPSAELRPNQTDQDSLPPYETLDAVLERYETQLQSGAEIVGAGFDDATVSRLLRLMQVSEYKRQQAAPGLKVTSRAFGFGRRMPIAAKT
ncbi:MAG: NAD+ synthase [Planctomycetes bacterium]|nr:NAD+ synthase [Planctomycetota bacterium]